MCLLAVLLRQTSAKSYRGRRAPDRALFGTPASLGAAAAWIGGLLAVFIPLFVWRYRRMS
jgi:hypothetical protein